MTTGITRLATSVSPLVGRDRERDALRDAIASASDGTGRAVVLRGEAGIGKTRLATDAVDDAVAAGFTALRAVCHPLDADLSLAAVVGAIRPVIDGLTQRRRVALVSELPDLARLIPELEGRTPEALSDAALERTRLLHALDGFLGRLDGPVALLVDDLQWADTATVQWLDLVVRTLDDRPLLMILTVREPNDGSAEVDTLLASLRRLGVADDLVLERLSYEASVGLVRGMLGTRFPGELVDLLEQRTSGVPLFLETIVRDLVDREALTPTALGWAFTPNAPVGEIPPVARDSILQRLERLTDDEGEVLRLLSVYGDAMPSTLLADVLGGDPGLPRVLDRLVAGGYLVEDFAADVRYRPAHPLIGEVSYDEMTDPQRARTHLRLLRALPGAGITDPRRSGRHVLGAGRLVPPEEAMALLDRAAADATGAGAPREAARFWRAGADHAASVPDDPRTVARLANAAEAALRDGDVLLAVESTETARAIADRSGACGPIELAHLLRLRAEAEWNRGDSVATRGYIDAAYEQLAGQPPSSVLADVMQIDIFTLERAGDLDGLREMVPRAERLADDMDSPRIRAQARLAGMGRAFWLGEVQEAWEAGQRALDAAKEAGDDGLLLRVYDLLATLSTELPDHRTIRAVLAPGVELARRIGATTSEIRGHGCLAIAAFTAADFDEMEVELAEVIALARRGGIDRSVARAQSVRPIVLGLRGRLDDAEQALAEAKAINATLRDAHIDGTLHTTEGYLAIEIGDVERGLDLEDQLRAPGSLLPRRLTVLAELLAMGDRVDDGLAVVDQIESLIEGNPAALALATRARGHVALAGGDRELALTTWRDAVAQLEALDARWEAMRTRACVAELTGEVDELERCRAFFDELGLPRWSDRMRAGLRAQGVRPAPPRPSKGTGPLSERELEVARLAAEGLTNNQIAERLVISKYTAGSHLRRIYARLEVSSRAALTKRMAELGLL